MDSPGHLLYNLAVFRSSDARRLWRESIFDRDGHRCSYCGSTQDLTLDHRRPRCKGGPTTADNCVTACRACNQAKGSMAVEQFLQLRYA